MDTSAAASPEKRSSASPPAVIKAWPIRIILRSPILSDIKPLINLPNVIPKNRQVVPNAPALSGSPY